LEKRVLYDNIISLLQTLAKLCLDNISAMSDFYNFTVKHIIDLPASRLKDIKKGKVSPYSITERRVPELIPVLGSQPAGDVSH